MPNNTMNPSTEFVNAKKIGIKLTSINKVRRFTMQNNADNVSFSNGGMSVVMYGATEGKMDTKDVRASFIIGRDRLRLIKRILEVAQRYSFNQLLKVVKASSTGRVTIVSSPMNSETAFFINFENNTFDTSDFGGINITLTAKDKNNKYHNYSNKVTPLLSEKDKDSNEYKTMIRNTPGIKSNFMTVLIEMCDTTTGLQVASLSNYANQIVSKDIDVTPDAKAPYKPQPKPAANTNTTADNEDLNSFLDNY